MALFVCSQAPEIAFLAPRNGHLLRPEIAFRLRPEIAPFCAQKTFTPPAHRLRILKRLVFHTRPPYFCDFRRKTQKAFLPTYGWFSLTSSILSCLNRPEAFP